MDPYSVTRDILLPLDLELPTRLSGDEYSGTTEGGIDVERPLTFLVTNTCYTQRAGVDLLQIFSAEVAADTMGRHYLRRSRDNGDNWSNPGLHFAPEKSDRGVRRRGESALFLDKEAGRLVEFTNEHIYPDGTFSGDVKRFTRIVYRVSFDGGVTFGEELPLVERGGNELDWARGVTYGENCIQLSFCQVTKLRNGSVLVPICLIPKGADYSDFFGIAWEAGCFIGRWSGDSDVWDLSSTAAIEHDYSTRGADEPTIAELSDGSLLMVFRGSNARREDIPGHKWICRSSDLGHSWSRPAPFCFSDGSRFFSPAAGSLLIRHSRTKRLYWIGNIAIENPRGNRPRFPLQIAEVDESRAALIKETVRIIDDRAPGESELLQLSNFKAYEDRISGEIVLALSRYQMRGREDPYSPAYRYRITPPG